ncbi:MAG: 30S ribosomal protein S16 [Bacteriovoracia bacterium]
MPVVIRMARAGTNKKPVYHIVAADKDRPRDGKYLQRLGLYNPKAKDAKSKITLDMDAYQAWVKKGAIPSETVGQLVKAAAK